jgi:hypothetical protein
MRRQGVILCRWGKGGAFPLATEKQPQVLRLATLVQDDRLYIYQSLTLFLSADTAYAVYFATSSSGSFDDTPLGKTLPAARSERRSRMHWKQCSVDFGSPRESGFPM